MMQKFKRAGCDDDDSWQVRAFQEDAAANMFGCTWPPRSYTCAFCRREFRSAQALGGHMNVHRRDRARLHELLPTPKGREFAAAATGMCNLNLYNLPKSSSILSPNPHLAQALGGHMNVHRRDRARLHELLPPPKGREFAAAATGMCNLNLYNLPKSSSILSPNPHMPGFSSLLPITPSSLVPGPHLGSPSFLPIPTGLHRSYTDPTHSIEAFHFPHGSFSIDHGYPSFGKVDLELRLGQRRPPPPP